MPKINRKSIKSEMLFSLAEPKSLPAKIFLFPLTRIIIAILFLAPVSIINYLLESLALPLFPEQYMTVGKSLVAIITIFLLIVAYKIYTRVIEKRAALEFSKGNLIKDLVNGTILGGGIITALVLVLFVFGYYSISSFSSEWTIIFSDLSWIVMAALIEEIIFRLIIFKLTEEFCGSWIALIVSILFFGFAHAGNPNATLWTSFAIGIEAGILFGAAFMLTRTIWFPLALHFGWNYFQAKIFGVTTSGIEVKGLIVPSIDGPEWMTGGVFGIEASVIAVLFCLTISVLILKYAIKNGQFVAPAWKRNKINIPSGTA